MNIIAELHRHKLLIVLELSWCQAELVHLLELVCHRPLCAVRLGLLSLKLNQEHGRGNRL